MCQKILLEIKKIQQKSKMPCAFFFTNRKEDENILARIKKLPKNSAVIFREYDLDQKSREKLAIEIAAICKEKQLKFLVGKSLEIARKSKADGVHFSDLDQLPIQIFNHQKFAKNFLFSIACHSEKSLRKYKNFDFIFLSPIFQTKHYQASQTFGIKNFARIVRKNKNILPLGGINSYNLIMLRKLAIKGFGAISLINSLSQIHFNE